MSSASPLHDPRQVVRWLRQHVLLGLLQMICALAALLSVVLTGATDLSALSPLTWALVAAFLAVSILRIGLFLARGRPKWAWLEGDADPVSTAPPTEDKT